MHGYEAALAMKFSKEEERIAKIYDQKPPAKYSERYTPLANYSQQVRFELNQALSKVIRARFWDQYRSGRLKALDFGCGNGNTLLDLVALGLAPSQLVGIDISRSRVSEARENAPRNLEIAHGGHLAVLEWNKKFNIIVCSLVLSSVMQREARQQVCEALSQACEPGGVIIIYDFFRAGSSNPDVRPVSMREIKIAFPGKKVDCQSLTLAPPIGRLFNRYPWALAVLAMIPFLRTHRAYVVTI